MFEINPLPVEPSNQAQLTVCSACGTTSDCCPTPLAPPQDCRRAKIREIFLAHGFKIKPDLGDLRPYVYEAAEALLAAYNPSTGQD